MQNKAEKATYMNTKLLRLSRFLAELHSSQCYDTEDRLEDNVDGDRCCRRAIKLLPGNKIDARQ